MEITINELVKKWEQEKRLYVKESTLAAYKMTIRKHVLPRFGELT